MIGLVALAAALMNVPEPIRGDFDWDGKIDVARAVRTADGYDLVIVRAANPRKPVIIFSTTDFGNIYVDKEPPGLLKTWCGKRIERRKRDQPCPRKILNLRGETLSYGWEEASMAVAYWNGKKFEEVWISD